MEILIDELKFDTFFMDKNTKSALKIKELVKGRIKECWKDREKFKKDKNQDMLYYTNDCLTQLLSLVEESENV